MNLVNVYFVSRDFKSHTPPVIRRVFPHCQKLDDLGVELRIDSSHVAHVLMTALVFVCKRRCLTVNKVLMVLKWLLQLNYLQLNLASIQTIPQMAAQYKKALIILCEKYCISMGLIVTHFGDIAEVQNC